MALFFSFSMNMSFFPEVKKLLLWTLANMWFYTYERWHLKTNVLWSNSPGALSKLLKLAAFSGNELPSTYTKFIWRKISKLAPFEWFYAAPQVDWWLFIPRIRSVPEGSRQKKSFCRQAADRSRAHPLSPTPYIQLFVISFGVQLILDIDSMCS